MYIYSAKVNRIFEFCKYLAKKMRKRGLGWASLPFFSVTLRRSWWRLGRLGWLMQWMR